jgi:hypothetical protein
MTGNSLISREKHVTPMSLTFAVDASSLALVQPVSGCFGVFRGVSGCFGVFRGVVGADIGEGIRRGTTLLLG